MRTIAIILSDGRAGLENEMDGTAALSQLVESFKKDDKRQIKREEFEAVLFESVKGSYSRQQIAQLWDKVYIYIKNLKRHVLGEHSHYYCIAK